MKLEKEFSIISMESFIDTPDITVIGNIKLNKNEKLTTHWNGKYKATLILETQEPILDEAERKYLSGVIRPFRSEVYTILKYRCKKTEWIILKTRTCNIPFPPFKKGTMYKGMELNKEYTLEELGL